MMGNFIDKNTRIYRYMSTSNFLKMLDERKLYFSNIMEWKDPWENFILQIVKLRDGKVVRLISNYGMGLYGFCWTKNKDADSFWRLYEDKGKNDSVVMIESTVGQVIKAVEGIIPENDIIYNHVKYFKQDCAFIENLNKIDYKYDYFFLKRDAFSYENEVRFLLDDQVLRDKVEYIKSDEHNYKIAMKVECDLEVLIKGVLVHTNCEEHIFEELKMSLNQYLPNVNIEKSNLYNSNQIKNIIYDEKSKKYRFKLLQTEVNY